MFGVVKRVWLVYRVRGYYGAHGNAGGSSTVFGDTKPFNPKVGVGLEVQVIDVGHRAVRAQDLVVRPNIVAQGHSDTIGCRITVDGVVKDDRISNGVNAQTFCLVKSA
jgi:hypothetical protein